MTTGRRGGVTAPARAILDGPPADPPPARRKHSPSPGVLRAAPVVASYFAAMAMISTKTSGKAMRASQVARPGVFCGSTQASQTAFISS